MFRAPGAAAPYPQVQNMDLKISNQKFALKKIQCGFIFILFRAPGVITPYPHVQNMDLKISNQKFALKKIQFDFIFIQFQLYSSGASAPPQSGISCNTLICPDCIREFQLELPCFPTTPQEFGVEVKLPGWEKRNIPYRKRC